MPRNRQRPPLGEVGQDPDYRFTLANERTFLAWVRTALGLIAAGAAVTSLLPALGERGLRSALGVALIVLGTVVAAASYRRWETNERALRMGTSLPPTYLTRLLATGVMVVALVLILLVLTHVR